MLCESASLTKGTPQMTLTADATIAEISNAIRQDLARIESAAAALKITKPDEDYRRMLRAAVDHISAVAVLYSSEVARRGLAQIS